MMITTMKKQRKNGERKSGEENRRKKTGKVKINRKLYLGGRNILKITGQKKMEEILKQKKEKKKKNINTAAQHC